MPRVLYPYGQPGPRPGTGQEKYCETHKYDWKCLPKEEKIGIVVLLVAIVLFVILKFTLKTARRKKILKAIMIVIIFWVAGSTLLPLIFTLLIGKAYSIFSALISIALGAFVAYRYYKRTSRNKSKDVSDSKEDSNAAK